MYNITDLISGITNIWLQSFDSWFRSLELITLYQIIIEKVKGEKGKVLPAEKSIKLILKCSWKGPGQALEYASEYKSQKIIHNKIPF